MFGPRDSLPREGLRHQENFGEAHLFAADGVVAHKPRSGSTTTFVETPQPAIFSGFKVCRVTAGFARVSTISSSSCRMVMLSPSRKEYVVESGFISTSKIWPR